MRDKYIELIKEYIKAKPEYLSTLDQIKADVLNVGATEEEFDEAIRQATGIPNSPNKDSAEEFIFKNTTQPTITPKSSKYSEKAFKLASFAKTNLKTRKKYIAVIALGMIMVIFASQLRSKPHNAKITVAQKAPVVKIPIVNSNPIPVVYANSKPVDVEKIFSIKSTNVNLTVTGKPKKEVLGFFPYWMLSKQDQINLSTLTSIDLFGLEVNAKGNIATQGEDGEAIGGWNMWKDPELDTFIKKAKNQDLKVNLTFKSFNSNDIEALALSDDAQKTFIANAIYLVNSKNLDGINIDFEYVGNPSDGVRDGFTRLITNLNAELKRQLPGASLTIDTYLVSGSDKGIFNIPVLANNSDAFVIMGYDMHTPRGAAGPVSAMGGDTNIVGYVQNYLEKVDSSKLILAVPYYGYDWPENGDGSSDNVKILPYAEIAEQSKNLQLSWNDTSQTPFFTYKDSDGTQRVVHFDNVRSLGIKYDFINKKNLKGVGIWSLGYDGQNQDLEKLLIDKFINI